MQMSMFSREVYEVTPLRKNSGTALPYRTQSVWWAPEQRMLNTLVSGAYTMGRILPQRHYHSFVELWQLRHAAAMLMRGKQKGEARMPTIFEKVEDLWYLQPEWGRGIQQECSHCQGAPTGHVCDHRARSHSRKARRF